MSKINLATPEHNLFVNEGELGRVSGPIIRPLTPLGMRRKISQIRPSPGEVEMSELEQRRLICIACSVNLFFDWESLSIRVAKEDFASLSEKLKLFEGEATHGENDDEAVISDLEKVTSVMSRLIIGGLEALGFLKVENGRYVIKESSKRHSVDISDIPERYIASSAHRIESRNFIETLAMMALYAFNSALVQRIIAKNILPERQNSPRDVEKLYKILSAKPREGDLEDSEETGLLYVRDSSVSLFEGLFQSNPQLKDYQYSRTPIFSRAKEFRKDAETANLSAIREEIPFSYAAGGNFLVFKKEDGAKVMITTIPDPYITEEGEFFEALVVKEGKIVKISSYQEMEKFIESWGRSLGYEVLIITRNISLEHGISKDDNYHLDMFLGVLQGKYLAMPSIDLPYMTPESRDRLIEFFWA